MKEKVRWLLIIFAVFFLVSCQSDEVESLEEPPDVFLLHQGERVEPFDGGIRVNTREALERPAHHERSFLRGDVTMTVRTLLLRLRWLVPVLALSMPVAFADDEGDSDMLAEEPDATEETLTLPEDAAPEGHENAAWGLEQANEARADGRAYGEGRAAAADANRDAARRD